MQEAYPTGYGLTAVVGLTLEKLSKFVPIPAASSPITTLKTKSLSQAAMKNMSNASAAAP